MVSRQAQLATLETPTDAIYQKYVEAGKLLQEYNASFDYPIPGKYGEGADGLMKEIDPQYINYSTPCPSGSQ